MEDFLVNIMGKKMDHNLLWPPFFGLKSVKEGLELQIHSFSTSHYPSFRYFTHCVMQS